MNEPTNAELAAILRRECVSPGAMTEDDFEIAALRLEARGEISEALAQKVALAFCDLPKRACGPCLEKARAALEAAQKG